MRVSNRWALPGVVFYEVEDHGFTSYEGRPMYAYGIEQHEADGSPANNLDHRGLPKMGEFYESLDRALVAYVGEKYTGPRGAGGSGVGTAADWFMRMIGADTLVTVDYQSGQTALQEVLHETQREDGPLYRRARAITDRLEARGLTIATHNDGGKIGA
jgi:hypothetical protein